MDEKTFDSFRRIVYEKSGITLSANKVALVSARVGKRLRELDISDDREYLKYLLADTSGEEIVQLLDVISTNVTSFYREPVHFEFLGNALAEWHRQGMRSLRIWCAASSTGEEPYTLAMTVMDCLADAAIDMKILATDISTRVLKKARDGVYKAEKVEAIPPSLLQRYFVFSNDAHGGRYQATNELRALISFSRMNLSVTPFPMKGPMDAIFCRNVMIYFDNVVRKKLLEEAYRLLKPGGYLFVGHAESLTGMLSGFKAVKPSIYIKE
jgi:chemotaxis protein methyltransferase CheR